VDAVGLVDLLSGGRSAWAAGTGPPSGPLSCAAFAGDYVWVGGSGGAARYDRLLEQWQAVTVAPPGAPDSARAVIRIQAAGDEVFLATAAGLRRFDSRTETVSDPAPEGGLKGGLPRDLRIIGEELWCFGEHGIDVYHLRQRTWTFLGSGQGLRSTDWRDLEQIGGDLYLLHGGGLDVVETATRRVTPFEREAGLAGYEIRDVAGSAAELWFATDRGLLRWQAENAAQGRAETWQLYDAGRGASQETCLRVAQGGGGVFALGERGVDLLDPATDLFRLPLAFTDPALAPAAAPVRRASWDESGLRVFPAAGSEIGLAGQYHDRFESGGEWPPDHPQNANRHWGRLTPFFNHASGRSAGGLYDNTDPDQVLYGATWRGRDGDLVRRAEAGNRVQPALAWDPFFGSATLRGGRTLLEAGPRRGEKRRSLLRGTAAYGQRLTRSAREFFPGSAGPVFLLQKQNLLIGSARVLLNGRPLPETDYTLNHTLGRLFFTFTGWELLNEGDVIEVQYQYRLEEAEIGQELAQGEIAVSSGDAFQVAAAGLTQTGDPGDSASGPAFQAAQVAAEAFGQALGGEGRLVAALGAGQNDKGQDLEHGESVEADWRRGPWTVRGMIRTQTDSLPALEDRSTEFGALRGEDEVLVRFEPGGRGRLEGRTAERRGLYGRERSWHGGAMISPLTGTSLFADGDWFDAAADSLDRERWMGSLGLETAFLPGLLEWAGLRSSRLTLLGRAGEVRLDSAGTPAATRLRTRSLLARWAIVPGSKVSLYPEIRWSAARRRAGDGPFQPEREELAPRATIHSRDLLPGLNAYLFGEARYAQAGYDSSAGQRDAALERQGIARLELAPGVYWGTLKPVTLRLDLSRNAEDSLVDVPADYGLADLGGSWRDFPNNVSSRRVNSETIQATVAPHPQWLVYQSVSRLRATGAPEEQFYSARLEWRPRSAEQVYWKYILNRTLDPAGHRLRHRPGMEWYRRWSARLFTRSQFYATWADEPGYRLLELAPGAYADRRFTFPWGLGAGTLRLNLDGAWSRQTLPASLERIRAGGYARLDWQMGRPLLLRLKVDGDYDYSLTGNSSEALWEVEVRVSGRF